MKPNSKNQTSSKPLPETSNSAVVNQVFHLALFDHLPRKQIIRDPDLVEEDRILHPATIHLGLLFNKGEIQSDDDRVHALLLAFIDIVRDYKTPPKKILREDLDKYISKQVQYLVDCRQISKGMGNVIKFLRMSISKISPESNESDSKASLLRSLESFIEERIIFAGESISRYITSTINEDETILTFGSSSLIRKVLLHAATVKKFKLVIIDTRPLNEGLDTLAALSKVTQCVYSPLSGTAVALKDVDKVILGASCLLSNGSMLAPAGTAMVAALAKSRHIPVIVASESYKFSDKVQLDSIVFNELGHDSEIVTVAKASNEVESSNNYPYIPQLESGYRGSASLSKAQDPNIPDYNEMISLPVQNLPVQPSKMPFEVVNLRYDLTPLSNISVVATETGLIPPTSVPVLMREIQSDMAIQNR